MRRISNPNRLVRHPAGDRVHLHILDHGVALLVGVRLGVTLGLRVLARSKPQRELLEGATANTVDALPRPQ